jgi:hypothetical protein
MAPHKYESDAAPVARKPKKSQIVGFLQVETEGAPRRSAVGRIVRALPSVVERLVVTWSVSTVDMWL